MGTVKKILAPTDLSELSCIALQYAFEMARSRGAEVIVYYVIELGDQWSAGRDDPASIRDMLERHRLMLDRLLREKFPEELNLSEVRQVVEVGSADRSIVEKAKSEAVDRIVLATHGRTGLDHWMLGSVSEKVIARAPCSVLVVPAHKHNIRAA